MPQFGEGDTIEFDAPPYGSALLKVKGTIELDTIQAYEVDVLESNHTNYEEGDNGIIGPTIGNENISQPPDTEDK